MRTEIMRRPAARLPYGWALLVHTGLLMLASLYAWA